MKQTFPIQRGSQNKDYYINVLGYNHIEWDERQMFYKERSIKRQKIVNCKSSLIFCREYWISRFGENGNQLYTDFQSIQSKKCPREKKKRNSPRSINYWVNKGYNEEASKKKVSEFQTKLSPRCLEYWLQKENSLEDAQNSLHLYQSRGRDFWINRLGDEEGNQKMDEINEKRFKNGFHTMFCGGYSKISQELFHQLPNDEYTYFATNLQNNSNKRSGNEYTLKFDDGSWVFLDYINIKKMKIIEFDGEYWHRDKEKELVRDTKIISKGFSILHIFEKDYLKNKQEVITTCQQFLNN